MRSAPHVTNAPRACEAMFKLLDSLRTWHFWKKHPTQKTHGMI